MRKPLISHNPNSQITRSEVVLQGDKKPTLLQDPAAIKLVVQDAAIGEQWIDQKQGVLGWRESDVLYQSPRTNIDLGAGTTRANIPRFTVAKHVNSLVPTQMSGIFYDTPPFVLRPRPSTTQSTVRAKTALFSALLDEMDFEGECEIGIECQTLNGTGIWKGGCYTETYIEETLVRKAPAKKISLPYLGEETVDTEESDEFEVQEKEKTRWRPFFEFCPLGTILIDPGWRHPNRLHKAKWLIDVRYPTMEDLKKLRQQKDYVIPTEEEMLAMMTPVAPPAESPANAEAAQTQSGSIHHADGRDQKTTEDPTQQPMKMLERWDSNRVMTVLQWGSLKMLIRNNTHRLKRIPYFSANWWNMQNAGYGIGVGRLVGSDQRVEQGAMSGALDILAFGLNPQYVRSRGANVPTQQIRTRLAGIIDVDGKVSEAFKLMEMPEIPGDVWRVIDNAKQSGEAASGSDEAMVQGTMPGRGGSSIGRTATGAGNMAAASATRIQGPVGHFVKGVFIPFLMMLDQMITEEMPLSEIREILGEELGEDYKKEFDAANFMNARLKIEVLAGAHLAAKKAMAQALPVMIQIFENPHMLETLNATGWTVDLKELFEMLMEMSEWKNSRDIVRKMTDEEKQFFQSLNDPMNKIKGDLIKQQQKADATADQIDQKGESRLAEKLTMDAMARAGGHEEQRAMELSMRPGMTGEGAQVHSTAGREQ